eukprot:GILI01012311.1.p1 GENE.GILI01012311.1~~GILI01012311.1.p1  ORF type:complete len:642 (+),score=193.96 GILI01012311.1:47-1927(+)
MTVTEVFLGSLDGYSQAPTLILYLASGEVLVYHGFKAPSTPSASSSSVNVFPSSDLPFRFFRVPHGFVAPEAPKKNPYLLTESSPIPVWCPRIAKFAQVSGKAGLFLSGPLPLWLFSDHGCPVAHPLWSDLPAPLSLNIFSFTPFHNVNCDQGFIYVTDKGALRICQLPLSTGLTLNSPWPVKKVPLRCTPHRLCYYATPQHRLYILATSQASTLKSLASSEEEEGQLEDEAAKAAAGPEEPCPLPPTSQDFEIRLLRPGSLILCDRYALRPNESLMSLKVMAIKGDTLNRDPNFANQVTHLVVAGTAIATHEEETCKGRILVFQIEDSVAASAISASIPKLRLVYEKEEKSPISCVQQLDNYVLVAIGQRVSVSRWPRHSQLQGAAFWQAQLFTLTMNVVKNFLLVGDVFRGVYFVRYKEDPNGMNKSLTMLAEHVEPLPLTATEFIIDESALGMIAADEQGNLQLLQFAPQDPNTRGGLLLSCAADFKSSQRILKLVRAKMHPFFSAPNKKTNKHAAFFGATDGALGVVVPLEETVFRRLNTLHSVMVNSLPQVAGLNPRAFRAFAPWHKMRRPAKKNILDGQVLYMYPFLSATQQRDLARMVGSQPETILQNLRDLDGSISLF